MRQREIRFKRALAVMTVALLLAMAMTAYADDTERDSAAVPAGTKVVRSPIIEKLHQARRAGDLEAMRELEAMLPANAPGGESAGGTVLGKFNTRAGMGDGSMMMTGSGQQEAPVVGPSPASFGDDVQIESGNDSHKEWYHTMASTSDGDLYVASLEDDTAYDYVQIYRSTNGGNSWTAWSFVYDSGHDMEEPCIAIGEGTNGDTLLLAYIAYDYNGTGLMAPEVATYTFSSPSWNFNSVPFWPHWKDYAKPVIITDAFDYPEWYAYLTCEGIYDTAGTNVNVCSWRSKDGGTTWIDDTVVLGDFDVYGWLDPDITFGTSLNRVLIVTYNEDDYTVYTKASDTYGSLWNTEVAFYTHSLLPDHPVDPEIAAAANLDNVMVCCTRVYNSLENIGQGYSTDAGETWSTLYVLNGSRPQDEFAASLTACEGGQDWHVAYTSGQDHSVLYNHRPQDLSALWKSNAEVIDDMRTAGSSGDLSKKGIACNWTTGVACIAWSDARDNTLGDMDGFTDFVDNTGLMTNKTVIPENTGATIKFTLNAGSGFAGRNYLLLSSVSGTDPGFPLPGGYATLPLNWDIFTDIMLTFVNTALCDQFMGKLNGSGMANAALNAPPLPGYAFINLYFAFTVNSPFNYASNAVMIPIVP